MEKLPENVHEKDIAVILYVTKRLKKIFGKKAFQKIIYFVSRSIPLSFDFRLYWLGPFSKDLANTLDFLIMGGLVRLNEVDRPFIEVKDTTTADQVISENLSPEEIKKIDNVLDLLGNVSYNPLKLELLATVHFICKEILDITNANINVDNVYKLIREAKGERFSRAEVSWALRFLRNKKLL